MNRPTPRLLLLTVLVGSLSLQGCVPLVVGGAGMGAAVANDRRSSGAYVEDQNIEWKASRKISDRFGDRVHIDVTSFNRNLLLTGEVLDETTRAQVQQSVSDIPNLRAVTNEIQLAPLSTFSSRSNDAWISSEVKARFIDQATFGMQHVKVTTEAGTVYLMGLVSRREADAATEIARTTKGVKRVVRVFEYISDEDARRVEGSAQPPDPAREN